jgi:thioredoxin reductase (NADPH)
VITPDEVRLVPLFSDLGESELERLAHRSADIHLQPGKYVANEGETRALFVVLDGEAEVTKVVGGSERVVGRRLPGDVFGEVPVVLGTPMLANLRATSAPYLLETSVPGVFACGDARRGSIKRVAAAVGEGSMSIAFVHQFLQSENAALV